MSTCCCRRDGQRQGVVATLLHQWSRRRTGNFVALNCGALPETVIESELFGHEPGAFTGAVKKRIGRIEHASGGTLFLDEIEAMPPATQVKMLRVLEAREITPLGTNLTRPVDIRVVAAAKVDLGDPAARGDFREDLYYRLNVVTLSIPPLRERRDDIPLLFSHFLARASERFGREVPAISAAMRAYLATHSWPGNVRELSHFAERVALGGRETWEFRPQRPPQAERPCRKDWNATRPISSSRRSRRIAATSKRPCKPSASPARLFTTSCSAMGSTGQIMSNGQARGVPMPYRKLEPAAATKSVTVRQV